MPIINQCQFSQSAATLTVNAITRHVVASRLASWLVALDIYLGILEEYRLALVLVFPSYFLRYRSCQVGHHRVDV